MVLESGCGMGYFTLPMAEMIGPLGKVIAADLQPKMLNADSALLSTLLIPAKDLAIL